jgi:hypothetical protein
MSLGKDLFMRYPILRGLWRFLWGVLFIVIALGFGFASSGYAFSARTVAAIALLTGWFISEAVQLRSELLGGKVKRASDCIAVFLMFVGTLLLYTMYRDFLAPSATFLEVGVALLLTFSRADALFDLGRRLKEMGKKPGERQ